MTAAKSMLGYVLVRPGEAELREIPVPEPGLGEVVVKVTTASICATDLKIVDGRFPVEAGRVMGHEFVGRIVSLGLGVEGFAAGERVLVHTDTPCGQCFECLSNRNGQGCSTGGSINAFHLGVLRNGAHAEYVAVPFAGANIARIPDGVSDEQAVMLCDVASTGFSAVEAAQTRFGDVVAVIGQGPVGLAATVAARLSGAALVVGIDTSPQRLELAEGFGADVTLNSDTCDVVEELRALTGGRLADVVVEAVGIPATFATGLRLTRPAGVLSSVGNYGMFGELSLSLDVEAFMGGVGNKQIISSTSPGGKDRARRLLAMVEHGKFDLSPFVTHTYPLAEIATAYDVFGTKADNVFKVAIKP